jgi:hypothetical protein
VPLPEVPLLAVPLPEVPLLDGPPPLDVPLPDVPPLGGPPPVEVPLPEVPLPDPPLLGRDGVDEGGDVDGAGVGVTETGGADGALGADGAEEPEPALELVLPVPTLGAWVATTFRAVLVVA